MHVEPSRRRAQTARLVLCLSVCVLSFSSGQIPTARVQNSGTQDPPPALDPDMPVERELAGTRVHSYTLTLAAGEAARITVEQRGIDVGLRVLDAEGKLLVYVDGEIRKGLPEYLVLAPERASEFRVRVEGRDAKAPTGSYRLEFLKGPAAVDDTATYESLRLWVQSTEVQGKSVAEALRLITRAIELAESVATPNHRWISELLTRAGDLTANTGKRDEAERLFERAITVADTALGRDHPQSTAARIRLGALYMNADDFVRAEPLLEEGVTTTERVLGADHPRVAANLVPYALLHTLRRDWDKAYAALHKGIAIAEASIDPRDFTFIALVNNLGDAYLQHDEPDKAEPYVRRALDLIEKRFGPEDGRVASPLANLGIIARVKKDYVQALAHFDRAYAIRTRVLGASNGTTAGTLISIGNVHHAKGDYQEALNTFQKALDVLEVAVGPYHRLTMMALANMARSAAALGRVESAVTYQARVERIVEKTIALNLRIGSERQKLAYFDDTRQRTSRTLSFHNQLAPDSAAAGELAVEVVLQRKGRVLDSMVGASAALREQLDEEGRGLLDTLQAVTSEVSALALNGPGSTPFAEYEKRLRGLEQQQESLEAQISRRSGLFRAATQPLTLAAVQRAIPPGAALIEFIRYDTFSPVAAEESDAYGAPRYAAYVIRSSGSPVRADLGPAAKIEAAVAALRETLRDPGRSDVKTRSRALDALIFQPIRAKLGGTTRLLVSPDGALNLVPFEALLDTRDRYAVETYTIGYLTSGRDLLRLQIPRESHSNPLVIADPEFGEPAEPVAALAKPTARARRRSITTARDLRSTYFAPLTGTALEAREIQKLFPTSTVLMGTRATKSALRAAQSPAILHIASHGFFLEDVGPVGVASSTRAGTPAPHVLENPLIRSGMALAQANARRGPAESGILTALEAANLNLWGTQLVTLSACDTGVGEVVQGEGVYGLRRAFLLAGAESIVMSLWPVSDYVTRQVMTSYYEGLKNGRGRGDALRKAQLQMLKQWNSRHPFFWAGFIQAGAWGPLTMVDGKW